MPKYSSVVSITDHPHPIRVDRLYYDCVEELADAYLSLCAADIVDDTTLRAHLVTLCLRLNEADRYSKPRSQEWLDVDPDTWRAMLIQMRIARAISQHLSELDFIRSLITADRELSIAA